MASWPAGAQQAQPVPLDAVYEQFLQAQDPELAIGLGEQALAAEPGAATWTLKPSRDQFKWQVHAGVGHAYINRAQGIRADNIEKAIANFEAVLAILTRESAADDRAAAHNDTGVAYWNRIRGERADNQEKALSHFETALSVFTRDTHPLDWAQLQSNIASLYVVRIRGERAANLEEAISRLEAALSGMTREAQPLPWAMVQNNLGNAYRIRGKGDAGDNVESAMTHFDAAQQVFTRDAYPFQWAQVQIALALAQQDRKRGSADDNWKAAIAHLQAAQTVFTREAFPQQWAGTQAAIGDAFSNRREGDVVSNRKQAVAAYQGALTVQTRDAAPLTHLEIAKSLGHTLLEAGDCKAAAPVFASAREAFLVLFGQGLDDADTPALVAKAGPMFSDAAFCAAERGDTAAAVQLASESRARLLTVALKLQNLALSPEQRQQLDDLRATVRAQQTVVDAAQGADREAALNQLVATRQDLLTLVESAGSGGSQPETAIDQAREVADANSVILMPVVTNSGTKMLMLAGSAKTWTIVDIPDVTLIRISQMLAGKGSGSPPGWIEAYFANYFEDPDEQQRRWPQWLNAVDTIGLDLWQLFGERLTGAFKKQGVKPGARLVILPAGRLGVFPLGLAQDPASKRRLLDTYEIVYAPSLEALVSAHRQIANTVKPTLVAIVNPTGDLAGAEKEGAIVASHFAADSRAVLAREAATTDAVLAALKGKSYWHFASHGTFTWQDVRSSGLIMHDFQRLSVGRLAETDDLGRPRLVVLSACETGLSDIVTANPDEFIGLPGSFAALGAAGVVGTLWPVSDDATALLIAKFYELHLDKGLAPPSALRQAQLWLRDASTEAIEAYAQKSAAQGRLESRHLAEIKTALDPKVRAASRLGTAGASTLAASKSAAAKQLGPYAHPYYWGGFVYTGL